MKLGDIDLNLLVILDAIVSEHSVTAAAQRLGMSQPAVSVALRRLRILFDDPLLERAGARWRLTAFAHELSEPLRETLAAVDATVHRRFVFDAATSHRRFHIAAADDVSYVLVQPLIVRLEQLAPNVSVTVTRPDAETAERLAKRQIDLSIVPDAFRSCDFRSEPLYRDSWVVALWSGNTKVGKLLTREQFVELGHISVSLRANAFTLVERAVGALSQKLKVRVVSDSFAGLAMLLRGSQLIALIPSRLAAKLKDATDIRIVPAPIPLNELVFSMAWPELHGRDAGHAWFRKLVAEVASELESHEKFAHAI